MRLYVFLLIGLRIFDRGSILTDILVQSFAKKDLPESHRVLKPNDMKTMDHKPERCVIMDKQLFGLD